jgi:uncharacterized protein YebE (UPF0316 family)
MFGLDPHTLMLGIAIFLVRIVDVSLGTVRTISTVQGRRSVAFMLGLVEVSLWLSVIAAIIPRIAARPILGLFYAFGFSTGNVCGILIEQRLALGHVTLRVLTRINPEKMATEIRNMGFPVTVFEGKGRSGPVKELVLVCKRRQLRRILDVVKKHSPEAFFVTEPVGIVRTPRRPTMQLPTGWRAIVKKK